ncbi:MAG: hypothetical protein IKQ10_06875 [Oscillospiraceae bacterium]|nr:hypothetical protein [Oscillospiraceae bacterium]
MSSNEHTQWYIGAPNGVVLCINAVSGGEPSGELYHSYSPDPVRFENFEQMTLRMEHLYDELRFPHPSNNSRTFAGEMMPVQPTLERKKIMSDESLLSRHGEIGTFIVRVQHRQNSSWQGRITWMEQDKTVSFRSVWEMIKLIESAMDTVSDQEDEAEPTWFESRGD